MVSSCFKELGKGTYLLEEDSTIIGFDRRYNLGPMHQLYGCLVRSVGQRGLMRRVIEAKHL